MFEVPPEDVCYHSLWWWKRGDYNICVSTYEIQGQSI